MHLFATMLQIVRVALAILLISGALHAQNTNQCHSTLSGFIKDANGLYLPGATIWIKSSSVGTTSDENGLFELQNLCEGELSLQVQFVGYEPVTRLVTIPLTEPLVISLIPSVHLLRDVTV